MRDTIHILLAKPYLARLRLKGFAPPIKELLFTVQPISGGKVQKLEKNKQKFFVNHGVPFMLQPFAILFGWKAILCSTRLPVQELLFTLEPICSWIP